MAPNIFFSSWAGSCRRIYDNKISFLQIIMFDLLFLIGFSFINYAFSAKLIYYISKINDEIGANAYMLQNFDPTDASSVLGNAMPQMDFYANYVQLLKYVFLIMILVFILWSILQPAALLKSYSINNITDKTNTRSSNLKNQRYFPLVGRALLLSIVFFGLFMIIFALIISLSAGMLQSGIFLEEFSNMFTNILLLLLFLALLYFYFVGLSLLHKHTARQFFGLLKHLFAVGIKKSYVLVPAKLLILLKLTLVFLLINYVLKNVSALLALAIFIALLVPVLSWGRVFFVGLTAKLEKIEKN